MSRSAANRTRLVGFISLAGVCFFILFYHTKHQFHLTKPPQANIQSGSEDIFIHQRYEFQEDLSSLLRPSVNLADFKDIAPHNHNASKKQETFATFLCTPNASTSDPYFAATLNLVYRNLWAPGIRSNHRPFTVFVAPFVTQEQRDLLAGAGAYVKELELLPWQPNIPGVFDRWKDQFSKLHLWNQTEFSRLAYMDSDAFPINNIDSVFDEAITRPCNRTKLAMLEDDVAEWQYTFAGVQNFGEGVNGGFLVIEPDVRMHLRLLQNYIKVDEYDNSIAEQSFLHWQFNEDGPFPAQYLPRKYNAFFPQREDKGQVSVVHEKLWAPGDGLPSWLSRTWQDGWKEMIDYFDGPDFLRDREQDRRKMSID